MSAGENTKHTPGPWKAVQPTAIDYRAIQIQTDESLIAVCCGGGPKRAIGAPEERANARLIAAAPDLVEACKAALIQAEGCFLNHYPGDDPYTAAEPEHIAMLRAALSKAGV